MRGIVMNNEVSDFHRKNGGYEHGYWHRLTSEVIGLDVYGYSKGGADIHLDPPNISWISTKWLSIFVFPTYSCLQCISKCALFILYYFYASEDPRCASIRRRDGMVHDDYFSVRGGYPSV
jgi:hypothetical protein